MFTTDAVIKSDVAAALKLASVSDLPDWWDDVIERCHTAAYQEIVGAMLGRGFTKAQVDAWDRGVEFERTLALYFVFTSPQGAGNFDIQAVKLWDRREDLQTTLIYASGSWTSPGESPGTVGIGRVSDQAGVFNPIGRDQDNPNPMDW